MEHQPSGGRLECGSAVDSLIIKAAALVMGRHLKHVISPRCVRLKCHGGAKEAVRDVCHNLSPASLGH